jgi:hypothetical protein
MDKVPWNRVILEEFVSLALLTEEEENILRERVDPKWRQNQVHQSIDFYVSTATVTRRIRKMRKKYQSLVPYSDKLPENLDF